MVECSISLVINSNYKDAQKTIECIESNTTVSKQIYIVDKSPNQVGDHECTDFLWFISKYKDIEYLPFSKKENYAKSYNEVLTLLTSRYHLIMVPGVEFKQNVISQMINYMDSHLDCALCVPKVIRSSGKLRKIYLRECTVKNYFSPFSWLKTLDEETRVPVIRSCCFIIQTNLFKDLHGFDPTLSAGEDIDFSYRVNLEGNIIATPSPKLIYDGKLHRTSFRLYSKEYLSIFKKWGWKWK